ncbi:hypothetical protein IJG78_02880 [Candidatus Saccharibacteria bacterium]|nr:hypothetical protein [Candidatus Saccharibacteria bacterium]
MPSETDTTKKTVGKDTERPVKPPVDETLSRVIEKIEGADSILVALSRDPSVDEIAAAIGLTLSLDRMGKHATAIYSGKTPNAVAFLEPEKTFETNTNSLQDFIIALDKEKADHLRYKIEGDFVKVYITPYRTTINESDLEFSHGEVNVDMVISLNVVATEDLDAALAEHGRIMHDAVSINISNGVPGRLGGLEWNDTRMSSVSEMIMKYLVTAGATIEKDVATALLTGIVAATERFSNQKTTPETMAASAELMKYGADQQLIVAHMEEVKEPEPEETSAEQETLAGEKVKPGSIDVSHEDEDETGDTANKTASATDSVANDITDEATNNVDGNTQYTNPLELAKAATAEALGENLASSSDNVSQSDDTKVEEAAPISTENLSHMPAEEKNVLSPEQELEKMITGKNTATTSGSLMADLVEAAKAEAEKDGSENSNETKEPVLGMKATDDASNELSIDKSDAPEVKPTSDGESVMAAVPTEEVPVAQVYNAPTEAVQMNDKVMQPVEEIEQPKDYGAMMEEALAESTAMEAMPNPAINAAPNVATVPEFQPGVVPATMMSSETQPGVAPAAIPTAEVQPSVIPAAEQNVADMVNQMVNQAQPTGSNMPIGMQAEPVMSPTNNAVPELPPPPVPPMPPMNMGASPEMVGVPSLPPVQPIMEGNPAVEQAPSATGQNIVPPTDAQDTSAVNGIPEAPQGVAPPPEPVNPVVVQPIQDPTKVQPVQDPGAFKIPGM